MSYRRAFDWNHDFPRLVRQLGFKFITDRPKLLIDWNLIGCVDIESIVFNSEVITLEKHINDVIYYSLQGEEIKILDPKFVKLFRLAQLTIEYLIFCLHYLDKGFVQLQDNISAVRKENEDLREEIFQKEKSIQKYKKKISDLQNVFKNNENICTEEIFQCEVCKKQFINETFLNAHQARRQHTIITLPQSETKLHTKEDLNLDTQKLFTELQELKERLNNTEHILKCDNKKENPENIDTTDNCITKIDKDVQVDLINKDYSDDSVQCNLGEDEEKREQLTTIQMELKQWREDEANKIFDQLEKIKEKFNENLEKIHNTTVENLTEKGTSDNELHSFQELEEKFEKKLETNIERIKNELTNQERSWRDKLANLELKTEITKLSALKSITTPPKQSTFRIQHNSPVIIKHVESSDSSSISKRVKFERKSVQTTEVSMKDEAISVVPCLNTSNQATATNEDFEYETSSLMRESYKLENSKKLHEQEITEDLDLPNSPILNDAIKNTTNTVSNIEVIETDKKTHENSKIISKMPNLNIEKYSITNLKNIGNDENFLYEFRKTIEDIMNTSLQELGVDPQWKSIPQNTFENHLRSLQHSQKFLIKTYPNYNEFKGDIINKIDRAVSEQTMKTNVSNIITPNRLPKRRHVRSKPHFTKKTTPLKQLKQQKELPLDELLLNSPLKIPPKPTTEITSKQKPEEKTTKPTDQVNSMKLFRRAKSLHILNRQKEKSTVAENLQRVSKSQPEIHNPNLEKIEEKSPKMLSSILKVKDKVCSVFKSSTQQKPNILHKANGDETSNIEAGKVTQGVYKLTAFDEKNNPIQPIKNILTITPVGKKKNIFQKPQSKTVDLNDSTTLSESEDTDFSKIKTVHFKNNRNLEKSHIVTNTVVSGIPKTQNFDPFISKSEQFLPLSQKIKVDVIKSTSMYGDHSESSNISEQSFSPNKVHSTSTPKNVTTQGETNLKIELTEHNFLKPSSSFLPVKKKVIFDLHSTNSSKDSLTDHSKIPPGGSGGDVQQTNEVMLQQGSGFIVNQMHQPKVDRPYANDGDSTSISSSVFDGSTKNTTDDKAITKDNQNKNDKKFPNDDDLVLSDFDLSIF